MTGGEIYDPEIYAGKQTHKENNPHNAFNNRKVGHLGLRFQLVNFESLGKYRER